MNYVHLEQYPRLFQHPLLWMDNEQTRILYIAMIFMLKVILFNKLFLFSFRQSKVYNVNMELPFLVSRFLLLFRMVKKKQKNMKRMCTECEN